MGNLVTKNEVQRFSLKERGASTLGGLQVWFDQDVLRLNYEGRGTYLGEFRGNDKVLVILKNGEYYTTGFQATNHYDDNILRIEKFRPKTVWTAALNDAEQGFPYLKRFTFDESARHQRFVGETDKSSLILLTDQKAPVLNLIFDDPARVPLEIDAVEFIGVKSFKAKGKRLTTLALKDIELLPEQDVNDDETEEQDSVAQTTTAELAEETEVSDITDLSNEYEDIPTTPSLFNEEDS